jgi:histidyl-tRNA synthetase
MNKINPRNVRGMPDVFGDEAKIMEFIIEKSKNLAESSNFTSLFTPLLEFSEIFERTIGESSDIVNKEIYSFLDRSSNKLALRPEFTASVIRSVASNKMHSNLPLKLFSYGPVFRYDRPQKCRQRQFNQINYEFVGLKDNDPLYDSMMIFLAMNFLKQVGISEFCSYKLHINSIGNQKTRNEFEIALIKYLENHKDHLSEESLLRLEKNPLRILDTKLEHEKEILKKAPKIFDFYDEDSKNFFEKLLKNLDSLGIEYVKDETLVRGLDYYEHSVCEIVTQELGAQGTILAGGRYSSLSEHFGIGKIPCFGFAAGIERLIGLILNEDNLNEKRKDLIQKITQNKTKVSILCIGDESEKEALEIFSNLIENSSLSLEIIKDKKLNKILEKANKILSKYVIFVGENEISTNQFIIRNLETGEQTTSKKQDLSMFFK